MSLRWCQWWCLLHLLHTAGSGGVVLPSPALSWAEHLWESTQNSRYNPVRGFLSHKKGGILFSSPYQKGSSLKGVGWFFRNTGFSLSTPGLPNPCFSSTQLDSQRKVKHEDDKISQDLPDDLLWPTKCCRRDTMPVPALISGGFGPRNAAEEIPCLFRLSSQEALEFLSILLNPCWSHRSPSWTSGRWEPLSSIAPTSPNNSWPLSSLKMPEGGQPRSAEPGQELNNCSEGHKKYEMVAVWSCYILGWFVTVMRAELLCRVNEGTCKWPKPKWDNREVVRKE